MIKEECFYAIGFTPDYIVSLHWSSSNGVFSDSYVTGVDIYQPKGKSKIARHLYFQYADYFETFDEASDTIRRIKEWKSNILFSMDSEYFHTRESYFKSLTLNDLKVFKFTIKAEEDVED